MRLVGLPTSRPVYSYTRHVPEPENDPCLSLTEAYSVAHRFAEAYFERGGRRGDELALFLSYGDDPVHHHRVSFTAVVECTPLPRRPAAAP
jgi:hypothetical protein